MKRSMLILIVLTVLISLPVLGDDYAKINGWHFENFGITHLPWELFEKSYIGINPADPMDQAFYSAYNAAFAVAAGNCFGMSLLSLLILHEEGHMGFCRPIYVFEGDADGPADTTLRNAIIIMQCHEWSHAGITWLIDIFNGHHLHDALYAYDQIKYYMAKDDPPMLTLVKDYSLVGHTIVPYRTEERGGNKYIYVYDSNRFFPEDSSYYLHDSNYIEIKPSGDWTFTMADGDVWGSPDGMIFVTPISVVRDASRNPLELGAILDELNGLFLAGASVSQITDNEGHRLYKTEAGEHLRYSDIEKNPAKRIRNIVRMPFIGGRPGKGKTVEIYFFRGAPAKEFNIKVTPKKGNYKFTMAGGRDIIRIEAKGSGRGKDEIKIGIAGKKRGEVLVKTKRGRPSFDIEITKKLPREDRYRSFTLKNVKIERDNPVFLKITEDVKGLLVKAEKREIVCDLKVAEIKEGKRKEVETKGVRFTGDKFQLIAPDNWKKLDKKNIKIREYKIRKMK